MRRQKLLTRVGSEGRYVALTRAGRARARRRVEGDPGEHRVKEAEQLLDLIYRARGGGSTRYVGDDTVPVDQIWHVPIVQAASGVDAPRFDALVAALEADELVGPSEGSYRTITSVGERLGAERVRAHRLPGGPFEPERLLPPVRRPRELIRRREDMACPNCGHYALVNPTTPGSGPRWQPASIIAAQYAGDEADGDGGFVQRHPQGL